MSFSEETRLKEFKSALALMFQQLGDKALDTEIFYMNEDPFSSVPQTTWRELEAYGFTKRYDTIGHPQCQLTGLGWYNAVLVTDRISDPQFKAKLSQLTAALKDSVKGRNEDAYVYPDGIAYDAEVTEDFVFNAIESQLIDRHFNVQGAEWEHRGKLIRVPLEFGIRPLGRL